jgi:hypothetical protein
MDDGTVPSSNEAGAAGGPGAKPNFWLVGGGILSAIAALLHAAVIAGGPDWYRFFGAGEEMAPG